MDSPTIFTLVIAGIGCITGIAGLAINFYRLSSERFHLKILLDEKLRIYFGRLPGEKRLTSLQALARFRLINKSASPVTVYEVSAHVDGVPVPLGEYPGKSIILPDGQYHGFPRSMEVDMTKQMSVPLRIDSYDAALVVAFFPFFPDCETDTMSMKVVFKTTKGNRVQRVQLSRQRPT